MFIRFWGSRGSSPVSGKEYVMFGGDTTCVEILTDACETIIIDAGSGIRKLGNKLFRERNYDLNIIFTHSHWDHILGFPFFTPIYVKGTKINLYGCPFAQGSIKKIISKTMKPPNFPVKFDELKAELAYHNHKADDGGFNIGSLKVMPISVSHPNRAIGYKFIEDEKSFVFLTDNELTYKHSGGLDYEDYVKFAMKADLLVHDSQYRQEEYKRKETWGH